MESFGAYPLTLFEARTPDGSLVGILPMNTHRRPLHRRLPLPLTFLGIAGAGVGAADHVAPLSTDPAVTRLLLKSVSNSQPDRSIMLEHLDGQLSAFCEDAGLELLGSTPVPRLDIGSVDDAASLWSKKLRKNLRRRRRLAEEAGVHGRWVVDKDDVHAGLQTLRDLHLDRWQSQRQAGLLDDQRMRFLETLCADQRFDARIYLLETPDEPVGALLVFCTAGVMASYKTGWNPRFAELGIGIQLHASGVEEAIAMGLEQYDFLRGTGGHKYALNAHDYFDVTYGRFRGLAGRLLRLRERRGYDRAARRHRELGTGEHGETA